MSSASWQQGPGGPATEPARPGAVFPVRRMTLGEVFGGGFAMLRHSPKTMLGIPLAAGAVGMVLSALMLTYAPAREFLAFAYNPAADPETMLNTTVDGLAVAMFIVSLLAQYLIVYVAFAALAVPVFRAAYGYRTGFGQAIRPAAARFGALALQLLVLVVVGVVVAVGLFLAVGVVTVLTMGIGLILVLPGMVLMGAWLTSALMFGPFAVVVEGRSAVAALGRSWSLNRGRWWRHIGTVLLLMLMAMAAAVALSVPFMLIAGLTMDPTGEPGAGMTVGLLLNTVVGLVVNVVITAVFGACVAVMMLNARFEQEGLDVALLSAAEGAHDDGHVIPGSPDHISAVRTGPPWATGGGFGPSQPGPYGPPPQSGPYGAPQPGPYGPPPGYGANPYGQSPYGQNPSGPTPGYGQSSSGQNPYGPPPGYGRNPYGQPPADGYGTPQWGQRRPDDDSAGPGGDPRPR